MKEFYEENKKLIIALIVIIGVTLLFYIISLFTKEDNTNKYIENKDYVYTLDSNNNSKLPFINLDSDEVQNINSELKKIYYEVTIEDKNLFTYEYNINNNLLSILIKYDVEEEGVVENNFLAYNINLDSLEIYINDGILNLYNINKSTIENNIKNSLVKEYNYLIESGYVEKTCNQQCYFDIKGYKSIDDNLELYVKDRKVYGYLNLIKRTTYYNKNYPENNIVFELN